MPPEKFRALGHTLVDAVADFLGRLPDAPTASPLLPNDMRKLLGKRDLPEKGTHIAPILKKFSKLFFEQSAHNGSQQANNDRAFGTSAIGIVARPHARYERGHELAPGDKANHECA